ncbi:hypothetical protein STCU_09995 [Strigomonas culicis]|uniref:Leucine-rich repeat protein (LRRP) n=1 Tax=Strigomonas culicis TaxID=28005 RepID=S9UV23_9TRYP|nr:hypothetical protein STCU_09995 [Strigomonas culicis]|eukprot:EPY18381.1 hypothetical protein STCU_09995 [Strigomonas culicis]
MCFLNYTEAQLARLAAIVQAAQAPEASPFPHLEEVTVQAAPSRGGGSGPGPHAAAAAPGGELGLLLHDHANLRSISLRSTSYNAKQLHDLSRHCRNVVRLSVAMCHNIEHTHFLCPTPSASSFMTSAAATTADGPRRGSRPVLDDVRSLSTTRGLSPRYSDSLDLSRRSGGGGEGGDLPRPVTAELSGHAPYSSNASSGGEDRPSGGHHVDPMQPPAPAEAPKQRPPPPPKLPVFYKRTTTAATASSAATALTSTNTTKNKRTEAAAVVAAAPKAAKQPPWSHTLEELDLSYTAIGDSDTHADLPKLQYLRALSLEGCRQVSALTFVPALRHLKELDLSLTAIPVTQFAALGGCARLRVLRLSHCTALADVAWLLRPPPLAARETAAEQEPPPPPPAAAAARQETHTAAGTAITVTAPLVAVAERSLAAALAHPHFLRRPPAPEALPPLPLQGSLQVLMVAYTALAQRRLGSLALFPALRVLSLRGCRAVEDLGEVLPALPELEELDLSATGVRAEGLAGLAACDCLRHLVLQECPRLAQLPPRLPPRLESLDCGESRALTGRALPPACFGGGDGAEPHTAGARRSSSCLTQLLLRSCDKLRDLTAVRGLQWLRELDVYHTAVSEAELVPALRHCTHLEILQLSSTQVTDLSGWCGPPPGGADADASCHPLPLFFQTLRFVDLSHTAITAAGCGFLAYCPAVEVLLLQRCPAIASLSFLPLRAAEGPREALLTLRVTEAAALTNAAAFPFLAHCPRVCLLHLARSPLLTDADGGLATLARLRWLSELDLSGTAVRPEAALSQLQPHRPTPGAEQEGLLLLATLRLRGCPCEGAHTSSTTGGAPPPSSSASAAKREEERRVGEKLAQEFFEHFPNLELIHLNHVVQSRTL